MHAKNSPMHQLAFIALISATITAASLAGCRKAPAPLPTPPPIPAAVSIPATISAAGDPGAEVRDASLSPAADLGVPAPMLRQPTPVKPAGPPITDRVPSPVETQPGAAPVEPELADVIGIDESEQSPEQPEPAPGDALEVVDGKAARGVDHRSPIGASGTFAEGVVWAWVRVKNSGDRSQVRMIWKHDGEVRSRMDLDIGTSSGWRTWSRKTMTADDAGPWTVETWTWDGRLLDTMEFEVETESLADGSD
ncbi:MAG: hypothetical protein ACI9WU_000183 [Myxococcota bacterium]|jgi:hypothetical protein